MQPRRDPYAERPVSGLEIPDPYRWLENFSDPEVSSWVEHQDSQTRGNLAAAGSDEFATRLAQCLRATVFSEPVPAAGRYFFTERKPGENQPSLYWKDGLQSEPVKLVDPAAAGQDSSTSLDFWAVSRDGKYLAYGLSRHGTEMATLRILAVDTGVNLPDEIPRCRYSSIRWLPDASGFFYTRQPRAGEAPENELHLHTKIYLHKLGGNPSEDQLIFGEGRPKDDMLGIALSSDGKRLVISVSRGWTENDLYVFNTETGQTHPIAVGLGAKFSLQFAGDYAFASTDYGAPNGRVLSVPASEVLRPIGEWEEIIAEKKNPLVGLSATKSHLIAEYLANVCSEALVSDHRGAPQFPLPIPARAHLAGVSANRFEDEFFFGVESLTFPKISYRFNPATGSCEKFRETENPIDPKAYETNQEWSVSPDGTRVPYFTVRKKNATNPAPTILFGYGGFGSVAAPSFRRTIVPWIERGGTFAIANVRGGGEFGKSWHRGGILGEKRRSFEDFIAVAERLIQNGTAGRGQVGILGGSNGGLLVCGAITMRPDLFGAACAQVPLTDMVRFPKFKIALRWTREYGDPAHEAELREILSWSPYHNVREGVSYPPTLITTGENDTRVDPMHALKMTAALQWANPNGKTYLLVERQAGHGAGKPVSKIVEANSLILAFFAQNLNL